MGYSSNENLLYNTGNSTQFSVVQEFFLFTFFFLSFPHIFCLLSLGSSSSFFFLMDNCAIWF